MDARRLALLLFLVPVLGAGRAHGGNAAAPPAPAAAVLDQDPVGTVGHGAILGPTGEEIDPTPELVMEAQHFYIARLLELGDEKQREGFAALRKSLQAAKASWQDEVAANSVLIAWLVQEVKPVDGAFLLSKDFALRNRVLGAGQKKGAAVSAALRERLESGDLADLLAAPTFRGGAEYIEECRRERVPIPPDWVPVPPDWEPAIWARRRPDLRFKFIIEGQEARVYSYQSQSPAGICLALPRFDAASGTISALGIICEGTDSGKACFWDNVEGPVGAKRPFPIARREAVPLSRFAGGADLLGGNGICSDCHAGGNPFIVHPGEAMDVVSALPRANQWYEPIVHPDWPQNPGPTTLLDAVPLGPGDESCQTCHSRAGFNAIPEVTRLPGYCIDVLQKAVGLRRAPWGTMPMGAVRSPAYYRHTSALLEACFPTPTTRREVNGRTQATPTSGRSQTTTSLTDCPGGECPIGFCYWRSMHGPFWQRTDASIPPGAAGYRGSYARIVADGGRWKAETLVDATGLAPAAEPGGLAECIAFQDIRDVPNPGLCGSGPFSLTDPDGTRLFDAVDVGSGDPVDVLSGLIGNVAQSTTGPLQLPDRLGVLLDPASARVQLTQRHSPTPPWPFALGPLTGESWQNGCDSWTARYAARDVFSDSDVRLVAWPESHNVVCFLTGVSGAWSSSRMGGAVQPYAEIYRGVEDDIRLRVRPDNLGDRAGAYASCIKFR
jgi:hypothetical protein